MGLKLACFIFHSYGFFESLHFVTNEKVLFFLRLHPNFVALKHISVKKLTVQNDGFGGKLFANKRKEKRTKIAENLNTDFVSRSMWYTRTIYFSRCVFTFHFASICLNIHRFVRSSLEVAKNILHSTKYVTLNSFKLAYSDDRNEKIREKKNENEDDQFQMGFYRFAYTSYCHRFTFFTYK